jgi:hypothetical protein
VPVRLRAGLQGAPEVLTEIPGRAETAAVCDRLDGQVAGFEQALRETDTFPHEIHPMTAYITPRAVNPAPGQGPHRRAVRRGGRRT